MTSDAVPASRKRKRTHMPWSHERFLLEAARIHGSAIDYHLVLPTDVKRETSKVELSCTVKTCQHRWKTTVASHIHRKSGCPKCGLKSRSRVPWTYDRFLAAGKTLNGDLVDYSHVRPTDVKNVKSVVPLVCAVCQYKWTSSIMNHIHGHAGCNRCSNVERWTHQRLLKEGRSIHGDSISYEFVRPTEVKNATSTIELVCTLETCQYKWKTTITSHIHHRAGCPKCSGCAKWTYDRFIEKAMQIHAGLIDYANVRPPDVQNSGSQVQLVCTVESCKLQWKTSVESHIDHQSGCPHCARKPYTRDLFIERAKHIHGDAAYNYAQIQASDIWNESSTVPIQCMHCLKTWRCTVLHHIHAMSGCPNCNLSRGELQCKLALQRMGIAFNSQVRFADLGLRFSYDFSFFHREHLCLLEFDGPQHFGRLSWFPQTLEHQQQNDIKKSLFALQKGFRLIRIDYSCLHHVQKHLEEALRQFDADNEQMFYLSSPDKYEHIAQAVVSSVCPETL